jgi:predicted Zn-dependent peptidase
LLRLIPVVLVMFGCAKSPAMPENPVEESAEVDPLNVTIHKLENGLTVYFSENHEEPRIAARVTVRAGGAHDDPEATGMAHYLEHMLANKGTQNLGTTNYESEKPILDQIRSRYDELFETRDEAKRAELYATIDALGQEANQYTIANELKQVYGLLGARGLNAFTSRDNTAYVVDIPSNQLAAWAVLEGDRFSNPVFRSFQTEVETVYEEKNRAMDNASRQMYDAISAALFTSHPYGRSVLGTIAHLKNPSISRMEDFYNKWYVPNNMAVILAGDFDSDEALALIKTHFGELEPRAIQSEAFGEPPPLAGETSLALRHNADEQVRYAWQTVRRGHGDESALILADMLLDNSASGMLDKNLNNPQKLRASGSSSSIVKYAGQQILWGRPRTGQSLDEVKELLLGQLEMLKQGEFSDEELDAIRLNFRVRETAALESNAARVSMLMSSFVNEEEWADTRSRLDRLDAVTREEIQRVASHYFTENRVVLTLESGEPEIPEIEAPELGERPLNTTDHSALFKQVAAMETPALEVQSLTEDTDYTVRDTAAGKLYRVNNPYSDLSAVRLQFEAGSARDPLLCIGVNLWRRAGVGELDQNAWEAWLYQRAVTVRIACGEESVSLTISGPAAQLEEAIPMVIERLRNPVLDAETLKTYLEDYVARRQDNKITADLQQSALRKYALYGEKSSFLNSASDETILNTSVADYFARISKLADSARISMYVGPRSLDEVEAMLVTGESYAALEPFAAKSFVVPNESRIFFLDFDSVQSKVTVYGPDTAVNNDELAEYDLYGEMMGGSAGLVFQEIREARSLAYSAGGGYRAGSEVGDQNFQWGVVACQADKTVVATELLVDMLHNLPDQPARWKRSQESAIQRQISSRITFRSIPGAIEAWRRQGWEGDPRPELVGAVQSRSFDDIKQFAGRFREMPFSIVVLGNSKNIDLKALEAIAPVTEVQLEDLLAY